MSRHVHLFRRLVRLVFPAEFRTDYESEMTRTFGAQYREAQAHGAPSVARLWWETLVGLARTAPREHVAQLRQDTLYALRLMRRSPAFTSVAVLTLAVGIGANTAMFSVVRGVLLRPLPYADADSLVVVRNLLDGARNFGLSDPEFLDARERLLSMRLMASSSGIFNLTRSGEPERLRGIYVTANFFSELGVHPLLGRTFRAEEELPGRGDVVMLTHDLWSRLFNGAADAIGRSIILDGRAHTIVGVLPPSFVAPGEFASVQRSALAVPLTLDPAASRAQRSSHYLSATARTSAQSSMDRAQAELDLLIQRFIREHPAEYNASYRASLVPLRSQIVGEVRRPLLIMLGAVGLVLLIACANVANLLLARGRVRAREIAVRTALGAGHARLVRQVLTEGLVLAGIAAFAGVLLASALLSIIVRSAPDIPRLSEVSIDGVVLLFTAAIALATSLAFGTLPAVNATRKNPADDLHAARGAPGTMGHRLRASLVATQIALALVLLVGAGLLAQSFAKLLRVPAGFNPEHVLTLGLSVPTVGYEEAQQVVQLFERLLEGVRSSSGVVSAGAVAGLPIQTQRGDWDFYMEGETPSPDGSDRPADWQVVSPGYFEAMGIRLVRGRYLSADDRLESAPVVLVNETLARTFFPSRDPIGRTIRLSGDDRPWMRIVGIVGDVRQDGLDVLPSPEIYIPHAQFRPFWRDSTLRSFTIVVRTKGDPTLAVSTVRRHLKALDPNLPISTIVTMKEVVARSLGERRLHMYLLGFFGAVALALAVVGTYGVLAYQITERIHEFGVRMALGARREDIVRMVVRQGMTPAMAGALVGLGGASLLTRLLSTLLFETEPLDAATFAATASVLLAAALTACLIPARRAASLDPSTALRAE